MFKTHANMVVAGTDPRVLNAMSLGFQSNFTRYDAALDSRITFSRASSATYFDSTGTLQTAASGVARAHAFQDHNPSTLAPLGFLIEEARTNSIRNNTMQGAVVGNPGTSPTNWLWPVAAGNLTKVEITGVGTESGIAYIECQLVASGAATASITFEQTTQIVAANAQTWTNSVYLKLAAGALTNVGIENRIVYRDVAGAGLQAVNAAVVPTSAALRTQRSSNAGTASNASTARITGAVIVTFTGAGDITLRIGLPQLELGAFATSPIRTTGSAATRLAEPADVTGASFSAIWNAAQMSGVLQFSVRTVSGTRPIWSVDDGTANNQIRLYTTGTSLKLTVITGGVTQADLTLGSVAAGSTYKAAFAVAANDVRAIVTAGSIQSDVSATVPTVDRMRIGSDQAGNYFNGSVLQQTLYRAALPTATLQGLVA